MEKLGVFRDVYSRKLNADEFGPENECDQKFRKSGFTSCMLWGAFSWKFGRLKLVIMARVP